MLEQAPQPRRHSTQEHDNKIRLEQRCKIRAFVDMNAPAKTRRSRQLEKARLELVRKSQHPEQRAGPLAALKVVQKQIFCDGWISI